MSDDVPLRTDPGPEMPMRRHERAGSPSPQAIESATSWLEIKSRFVDDPAGAIAAAEELVQQAVEQRIRRVHDEAAALRAQGPDDDDTSSTEAMRTRLLRYEEYCARLTGPGTR